MDKDIPEEDTHLISYHLVAGRLGLNICSVIISLNMYYTVSKKRGGGIKNSNEKRSICETHICMLPFPREQTVFY